MERRWLERGGNDKLLVLVLGWAADWRVVEHLAYEGYDVVAIYDYRAMNDAEREEHLADLALESYKRVDLVAWSFGVWVAEQLFGGEKFASATAYNGTPFPVHKEYGIEPRRMAVTIRGLKSGGMELFSKRTYGKHYDEFEDRLQPRSVEDNVEELVALQERSTKPYEPTIEWSGAEMG